ncbi:MAG: hypothetical protein E7H60_20470 [Pseudomonas oryzihabitans]|jgi:hypothetical protein|uniref:DUF1640 domain-containing protein n=2 Tax=Pseudomonas TaxID=286 RepID=A0A2Z5ADA7_9PSED|nr:MULTISPECIES: hypothetical protein [Pseudomonas]QOU99571.1 hypothetical protein [Pseudomonas syringae pv. actinidiae]AXA68878.1 hypothetical protein CE139_24770 [Pseudomonas oryzihabitans]KIZ52743.1 hypothetical protein UM91_01090 [Pseudomonas oryzihabitans]MBA1256917.1 hypothetical protein [Pseudomonas psychrotolerans]MCI1009228.1 hypothetical protein [Pseudomonas oryzihabitans]
MKSSFALYQALIAINVPDDKATAVIDALESDMQNQLATKADLADIKAELAQLELKLTIRMGVMLSAAVGILLAAMKFMH